MKYFLLRTDLTWSDFGDYPSVPANRPDGIWVEGEPPSDVPQFVPKDLNKMLEEAFLSLIPKHYGQPYMDDVVVGRIMQAKVAVTEANLINPELGKATIRGLELPPELNADRDQLLAIYEG